jgi:hypothetical protein
MEEEEEEEEESSVFFVARTPCCDDEDASCFESTSTDAALANGWCFAGLIVMLLSFIFYANNLNNSSVILRII